MVPKHQPVIYHAILHDIFRRSVVARLHLPNWKTTQTEAPQKAFPGLVGRQFQESSLDQLLTEDLQAAKRACCSDTWLQNLLSTYIIIYIYIIIFNTYSIYIYINYMGEKTCHKLERHRCMDGWYVYVWEFWGLSTDLGVGLTCSSETSPVNNWETSPVNNSVAKGVGTNWRTLLSNIFRIFHWLQPLIFLTFAAIKSCT